MSEPIHALAQLLFGKSSVEECSVEEIQQLAKRYPYFAPAQFLLLQKLKAEGSADSDAQQRKAVLYYPDPLQFENFISPDKFLIDESQLAVEETSTTNHVASIKEDTIQPGNNVVAEEQSFLQQPENIAQDELSKEEDHQRISPVFFVYEFSSALQEDIKTPEQVKIETAEETPVEESEVIDHSSAFFIYDFLPGIQQEEAADLIEQATAEESSIQEVQSIAETNVANVRHDKGWEPLSEEGIASPIEIPAEEDESREPISEEVEAEHENVIKEQTHTKIHAFVENVHPAESFQYEEFSTDEETKQNEIEQEQEDVQQEVPGENEVAINEEAVTSSVSLMDKAMPKADEGLIFEPYHTVDYFASQGIKIPADDLSKDKLGKQLRSFTEWLKMMKRLPAAQIAKTPTTIAEKSVESMANHSITESDVVTEAMAEVWAKQGNREKAIETYNKLCLLIPSKKAYFAAKIENLKLS